MCKIEVILLLSLLNTLLEGSYLKMPSFSYLGHGVTMECNIDHGDLPIISITWLKDDKEFYKYDPNQEYPVMLFQIDGVEIKKDLSLNGNKITIGSVTNQSAGIYKCNVQIDHPSLDNAEMTGTLKILQN